MNSTPARLNRLNIHRTDLTRPLSGFGIEFHPLAVIQSPEASALDGGAVHEDVWRAVIRLNEAIALLRVEPLHRAHWHGCSPISRYPLRLMPSARSMTRHAGQLHTVIVVAIIGTGPRRRQPGQDPDRQIQLLLIAERYRVLAKRAECADAARVKDAEEPDPD